MNIKNEVNDSIARTLKSLGLFWHMFFSISVCKADRKTNKPKQKITELLWVLVSSSQEVMLFGGWSLSESSGSLLYLFILKIDADHLL